MGNWKINAMMYDQLTIPLTKFDILLGILKFFKTLGRHRKEILKNSSSPLLCSRTSGATDNVMKYVKKTVPDD